MDGVGGASTQQKKKNKTVKKPKKKKSQTANAVNNTQGLSVPSGSGVENADALKKKRTRVRKRPNLQQFVLDNTNSGEYSLINSMNNMSMANAMSEFKDAKDDLMKLQSLYFKMNNLNVNNTNTNNTNTNNTNTNNTNTNNTNKAHTSNNTNKTFTNTDSLDRQKREEINKEKTYEPFIKASEMIEGVNNGTLIKGSIRINPRCFQQAYVSHPDGNQSDILINGVRNRNRALEDDIVAVQLVKSNEENDHKLYGKVVFIIEHEHSHVSTGTLRYVEHNKRPPAATFLPRDKRFPNLFIPLIDCPPNYQLEYKQYENTLFSARIVRWVHPKHTVGTLLTHIGQSNELKAQSEAILIEYGLNHQPYGTQYQHLYPDADFVIPDEEITKREDFRDICVFTIDPATARDLDDAVSCKKLDNGNYEIGVHISDVTYYLEEGTLLDKEVEKRATTVYMVDGTYHMLPKDLCLHCSLLPGTDKLTFSVVWEFTPDGDIIDHRFTRGIINSCCQLAYEHVQHMIDNPNQELQEKDYPHILGQWNLKDVKEIVDIYHKFAVQMRTKRFEGGALRIDQPKVMFQLDPISGNPLTFKIEEHNESHRLIEEFMLLANCTVAEKIFDDFPQLAFLRLHPPPKNSLDAVAENLAKLGIDIDISSAGQLHYSLAKHLSDDNKCKHLVLQTHLVKTLSRAKYFCADGFDDDDIRHYALNIPLYTHFTSPIRRYADIVVHRLLSASLGYISRPKWKPSEVQRIANNCNKQKYNAKRANDMSCEVYYFKYISIYSPVYEKAAIMEILDNAFDVILFSSGFVRRVYFDNFSETKTQIDVVKNVDVPNKVVVKWETEPQIIQTFSIFDEVNVILEKTDNLLSITTKIAKPL